MREALRHGELHRILLPVRRQFVHTKLSPCILVECESAYRLKAFNDVYRIWKIRQLLRSYDPVATCACGAARIIPESKHD